MEILTIMSIKVRAENFFSFIQSPIKLLVNNFVSIDNVKHFEFIMVVLEKNTTKEFELFHLLYQIHTLGDKIHFFEAKYKLNFDEFEDSIVTKNVENFEEWDDYIEWKANSKLLNQLLSQKKDIESGDFKVS
jgi:hypothetical protein